MKLYLIGNGFDLAHNLKTHYNDFRQYLIDKYNLSTCLDTVILPSGSETKDGEIVYDKKEVLETIFALIEEQDPNNWSDFEAMLGKIDYKQFMPDEDDFDEDHPFRYGNTCEDIANVMKDFMFYIKSEFKDWIQKISLDNVKKKFKLDKRSLFLTFNYTYTLEKIYKIMSSQVCHIHGVSDDKVIVGHNEERDFEKELSIFTMADITLCDIHDSLRKDCLKAYNENIDFFKKIYESNIDEIFNIGLGLSDIDLFYLKNIFNYLETDKMIFYISKHDNYDGKFNKLACKLRDCGFKGKIKIGIY